MEAAYQLVKFLVGVVPVARPPCAEGKARRKWDAAGHTDIIAERLAIVVAPMFEPQAGRAERKPALKGTL